MRITPQSLRAIGEKNLPIRFLPGCGVYFVQTYRIYLSGSAP